MLLYSILVRARPTWLSEAESTRSRSGESGRDLRRLGQEAERPRPDLAETLEDLAETTEDHQNMVDARPMP